LARLVTFDGSRLANRRPEGVPLQRNGHEKDADRDRGLFDLVRMAKLREALVERKERTHRKQDEGDHERPEVAGLAVAELVLFVLGAP
jgi:hypothetical protein